MPVALEYMKGRVFFVSYAGSKEELRKFDEKCECLNLGSNQGPAEPRGGCQFRWHALDHSAIETPDTKAKRGIHQCHQ